MLCRYRLPFGIVIFIVSILNTSMSIISVSHLVFIARTWIGYLCYYVFGLVVQWLFLIVCSKWACSFLIQLKYITKSSHRHNHITSYQLYEYFPETQIKFQTISNSSLTTRDYHVLPSNCVVTSHLWWSHTIKIIYLIFIYYDQINCFISFNCMQNETVTVAQCFASAEKLILFKWYVV